MELTPKALPGHPFDFLEAAAAANVVDGFLSLSGAPEVFVLIKSGLPEFFANICLFSFKKSQNGEFSKLKAANFAKNRDV